MQDCRTMQDMPNPEAARLCCTQCTKTPVQNIPLSFNRCSLSWGFSDDEAAASYGFNRIKSYQVQVNLSTTFMCPYVHPCNSSNPVVSVRANMQDCARHAKPGGCKIMLHTMHKDTRGKALQRTHPVQGHSVTPEHTVVFQSVQLVLGFL